jgi:hypothetical protein
MILLLTFWFGISLIHQKMRENIRKSTSQVPVEACYGNVIVWLKKWKLWRKKTFIFMTLIMFVLKFFNLIKQRDLILEKLNYIVTQYLPWFSCQRAIFSFLQFRHPVQKTWKVEYMQCHLNAWAVAWSPHDHRGTMLIYECCIQHVFLMFKHWFCWKYQYNQYMFNFIDIYSFISVSGCVGRGPSALLCPWAYNFVKTALSKWEHKSENKLNIILYRDFIFLFF